MLQSFTFGNSNLILSPEFTSLSSYADVLIPV